MNITDVLLFPINALKISLFPKKCMACGEIIDEDKDFCFICENNLEIINPKKRCKFCGNDKDGCTCKKNVYYFKNIVCVYKNKGVARDALYRFKLEKKSHYAKYFGIKMAECVKVEFNGIEFSAVISVPTALHSRLKRGFNHSRLLAQIIADEINVPYRGDILKSYHFKKSQHRSDFSSRFSNTRDKYYFAKFYKCKNVLLVDDIKTTGASLDACAKQLLLAGVENVYCVTALSSCRSKKKVANKENK